MKKLTRTYTAIMALLATPIVFSLAMVLPWVFMIIWPVLMLAAGLFAGLSSALTWASRALNMKTHTPRFLVVDDDPMSVYALIGLLKKNGADVAYVDSGREMIRSLAQSEYDAVFLDSSMPDGDGEQLLVEGDRELTAAKRTPVVFYTAKKTIKLPINLSRFLVWDLWHKQEIDTLTQRVDDFYEMALAQNA